MEKNPVQYSIEVSPGADAMVFESGWKAKQTNGSIWASQGGTIVLVTAVNGRAPTDYIDFLPLTVHYAEKFYSSGRFPGGFIKRETRPLDKETLTSRLIDRPLRPMFPDGFRNDVQVMATVVSYDGKNMPDILALNAASAALVISDIPFNVPVCSVRVGKIDGELVINPTYEDQENSTMNMILSGTSDALVMVEAGMDFYTEEETIEALEFGHEHIKKLVELQARMKSEIGKPDLSYIDYSVPREFEEKAESFCGERILSALSAPTKLEIYEALGTIKSEYLETVKEELGDDYNEKLLTDVYKSVEKKIFRSYVLDNEKRIDGRGFEDIRPIDVEAGLLPFAHGSSLFTRGETQALVSLTLGTKNDSQMVDSMYGVSNNKFMLHYNFPPFSVGETGPIRGPGRREIGHSALAERALSYVLPSGEDFPYTVRLVSEILESNGSSSMASVCGGCLALLDGGINIKENISGIAMGLIYEDGKYAVLSDILGLEDHLGDMDFKVTGTRRGITALQMDIKIEGLSREILEVALKQAFNGRIYILDKMEEALPGPREEMAPNAPRVATVKINPEKTGALIGPQGKVIKGIIEETGANIDILDDGVVNIYAADSKSMELAMSKVRDLTAEVEIGKVYTAKVKRIMEYGAFVEIVPGVEGLLHISQYSNERIKSIGDYLKVGDDVDVKLTGRDKLGRIELSRKVLLND